MPIDISNIKIEINPDHSVTFEGKIHDASGGLEEADQVGFFYSTTPNPDENDTMVGQQVPPTPPSLFSHDEPGLPFGERHYINAYARDASGGDFTHYFYHGSGNQSPPTGMEATIPKVSTDAATEIGTSSARFFADISGVNRFYNSNPAITKYGFEYSGADPSNVIYGSAAQEIADGSWNILASGLDSNTLYTFRGYVEIDSVTIKDENILSFTTDSVVLPVINNGAPIFKQEGVDLCGNLVSLGTPAVDEWGFFITGNIANQSPDFNDADAAQLIGTGSPAIGELHYDLSFNDFSSIPSDFVAGRTYHYNMYAKVGINYYYANNADPTVAPAVGSSFTTPKVNTSNAIIFSQQNHNSYTVQFDAFLDILPDTCGNVVIGATKGFFYSELHQDPSGANGAPNAGVSIIETAMGSAGTYSLNEALLNDESTYYFNPFVTDGINYHYSGGFTAPTGEELQIPDISANIPTDISGDAVFITAQHGQTTQTISEYGFYLTLDGSGVTKITPPAIPSGQQWSHNVSPPIDISNISLGGNALYHLNAYMIVDNIELSGNSITFNTPAWPKVKNMDISRNQAVEDASGWVRLRGKILDFGSGSEEISNTGVNSGFVGFYVHEDAEPRGESNNWDKIYTQSTNGKNIDDIYSTDSYPDFWMERGKIYYMNTYIEGAANFGENTPYGEFYEYSGDKSITIGRRTAGAQGFPTGLSFIIPKVDIGSVTIIDSGTAELHLTIDSSGHTIDIPGTDKIGFFINENSSNCFNGAIGTSNVEITPWDKSGGDHSINVNNLTQGVTYFYNSYTEYSTTNRGEGIDGDDFWYPPGYISGNSTNITNLGQFCIVDPSAIIPPVVDGITVDLSGVINPSTPTPAGTDYGFVYWHDGDLAADISHNVFGSGAVPNVDISWNTIHVPEDGDNIPLISGIQYYALPFVTQSTQKIYGNEIEWFTELLPCDVSFNSISNVGYTTVDVIGELNYNPPFPATAGLCTKFGFCYKIADTIGLNYPTITDLVSDIGAQSGIGNLGITISGLEHNKRYYIRTFAENNSVANIAYSASDEGLLDPSFVTLLYPPTLNVDISGNWDNNFIINGETADISGEIIINPDDISGNITDYGFCWKKYPPSVSPPLVEFPPLTIADNDDSINFVYNNETIPLKFGTSLSITDPHNPAQSDLSYNRTYYIRSTATNKSIYTNISDTSYNITDISFASPYPAPSITISTLREPDILQANLPLAYTYAEIQLQIDNYDPTIWGGIVEFGIIWGNQNNYTYPFDLKIETLNYDPSGGHIKRGNHINSSPEDFQEAAGTSSWGGTGADGWVNDASYATINQWPKTALLKIGVYNLLDLEPAWTPHLPITGPLVPKDPSSAPFNTLGNFYVRAYIITRSIIFHNQQEMDDGSNAEPLRIIYSDVEDLSFGFNPATCITSYDSYKTWEGYPSDTLGLTWGLPTDITFNSANLAGIIDNNPKIGIPQKGRVKEYGFCWWDGGKTLLNINNLHWPGKNSGLTPLESRNVGLFNITNCDGSKNYWTDPPWETDPDYNNYAGQDENWATIWDPSGFPFSNNIFFTKSENSNHEPNTTEPGEVIIDSTIWYAAYVYTELDALTKIYKYGGIGRFEQTEMKNFLVDMINPMLDDNTIKANITDFTIRAYGLIKHNPRKNDGTGEIIDYGFCWREVQSIGDEIVYENGNFVTKTGVLYPAPTIIDSSMVNLYISDASFVNLGGQNWDPSGVFPGISDSNFTGNSQEPPIIEDEKEWQFSYNIGDKGVELLANGGVLRPFFDISGGQLKSFTYYFIRSWVRGSPGAIREDNGETETGIKYGPLWFGPEYPDERNKGWVGLTNKLSLCEFSTLQITNIKNSSVSLSVSMIKNPDNNRLNNYGFLYIIGQETPNLTTIDPNFVEELAEPPHPTPFLIEHELKNLLPKTQYTIIAFANNTSTHTNEFGEEGDTEGGIAYSPNSLSITTLSSPPAEEKMTSIGDISYNIATFEGEIVLNFNDLISEHGFVWDISENPTILDSSFNNLGPKIGTGIFTYNTVNLDWAQTYYVKAWAKNPYADTEITYSINQIAFTTHIPDPPWFQCDTNDCSGSRPLRVGMGNMPPPWPGLAPVAQHPYGYKAATFEGTITKDANAYGGEFITQYGFCWATKKPIESSGNQIRINGTNGTYFDIPTSNDLTLNSIGVNYTEYTYPVVFGINNKFVYTSEITNLMGNTVYYIRAYAKMERNPLIIGYGKVWTFKTSPDPCVCVPVTTKASSSNQSAAMKYSQRIKLFGSATVGTRHVTGNLLGGRGKNVYH